MSKSELIETLTNRFLGYQFPKDMNPDGPLAIVSLGAEAVGTNLLTFNQARDMFEALFDGIDISRNDPVSFAKAVEALKEGKRVTREGWNGKDMWICISGPLKGREVAEENFWSKQCSAYARQNGGSAIVLPTINMKTADGGILMGWLASQTDILAEDWIILDD